MAAIIFDFDGTIADSFDYVADFLVTEAKLKPLNDEQRLALRGLSMQAMARYLGYSWWRMPLLFFRGRSRMNRVMNRLKPFKGMEDILRKVHAEGHELFMVSSNSVRNLHKFLHHHNLHKYFLEVYGGVGLFDKAPALRRLLREHNIETKDAIYIGDELRDVEAAQSIKLRVIAVRWGFARPTDLSNLHPTYVADSPEELMRILENV